MENHIMAEPSLQRAIWATRLTLNNKKYNGGNDDWRINSPLGRERTV